MPDILLQIYQELKAQTSSLKLKSALFKLLIKKDKLEGRVQPLGFYMFNLGNIDDDKNIRLHIWTNDAVIQDRQLMIHNHKFNITSYVICGTIVNMTYEIKAVPDSNGTLYHVGYDDDGSYLKKVKVGYSAILKTHEEINEDHWYNILADEFHESSAIGQNLNATLVLTEAVQSSTVSVYGEQDFGDLLTFKRTIIPVETSSSLIDQIIKKIS